ncbi:MAG: lytic transglycosylase domain-containing protein, partial [Syntrophobacterales bacterium]
MIRSSLPSFGSSRLQVFLLGVVAFLLTLNLVVMTLRSSLSTAEEPTTPGVLPDFFLPGSISLCDEPMPLENRRVLEMLDREFTIAVWDRAQVFLWLKRAGRYFPYIEEKLAEADMPDDLKYMAVAESALITDIKSRKRATGLWQFMSRTGRRYGLRKNRIIDERLDFEQSTEAAVKYLRRLHDEFGNWTLALAAYNCGDASLKREIRRQKVKDFYRLDLPVETERYVFRIVAIKIIMENPKQYGFSLPTEQIYPPNWYDSVPVKISRNLNLTDLALALDTDFKVLKELNPQ